LKAHQALLVIAVTMPVLTPLLFELFSLMGFLSPIALDPWFEILTVFFLLSFSFTPIVIVYYFAKQRVKGNFRNAGLSILTVVFYVGYLLIGASDAADLPLPLFWLSFQVPMFLTLLWGGGLAMGDRI